MSGGYPLGTKNLSYAPWNLPDPVPDYGQCPNCWSKKTFEARTWVKGKGWRTRCICKNCWNKFQ